MKAKPVIPRALALEDIDNAIEFLLEGASATMALGYVDEIERAFAHIGKHPGTGSPRYAHELDLPGLRAWALSRHPYLIFYLERESHIDVWRVLHERRNIPPSLAATATEVPPAP